jgi:hypothetical protein
VERTHEVAEPEVSRAEFALAVGCVALTLVTLVTFAVSVRSGDHSSSARENAASNRPRPTLPLTVLEVPATATKTPSEGEPVPSPPVALSSLLVDAVPEGYVALSPRAGPSGLFDLDTFVRSSTHPELDRAVFSENGFRQGFARSWTKSDPAGASTFVASVFEFTNAEGARAVVGYESGRSVQEDGAAPIPVPGGSGLQFVHREYDRTVHGYTVTLSRDGLVFYFGAFYSTPQPPDEVLQVAQRQLDSFG